jgi:hypothetical protein
MNHAKRRLVVAASAVAVLTVALIVSPRCCCLSLQAVLQVTFRAPSSIFDGGTVELQDVGAAVAAADNAAGTEASDSSAEAVVADDAAGAELTEVPPPENAVQAEGLHDFFF